MKKVAEHLIVVVAVLALIAIGFGVYAWSGLYNIGADAHHWPTTFEFVTMVRNRSLEVHARHIHVPNLDDHELMLKGAGQYAAMCTGCHLEPGVTQSEQREGMYPLPPDLSKLNIPPKVAFWAIKHGIKMSAMPAWGDTHDDLTIWSMVAFIEKLPGMTPAQYKAIVAVAPPDEDMDRDGHQGHTHPNDGNAGSPPAPTSPVMSAMPAHAGTSASH